MCDNKTFWGGIKPLLSNEVVSNKKILVEDGNILEIDKNTASVSKKFFSSSITNLEMPPNNDTEPVSYNIGDPLIKAIITCRFHPSIIAIKENCNSGLVSLRLNAMKS